MITKSKLGQLVKDALSGGDATANTKYDERLVWEYADIVRNTLIDIELRLTGNISDIFFHGFNNVEVKTDTDRDEKFSDLPSIIAATQDNLGLRQVSPMKDQRQVFAIGTTGDRAVFSGLEGELTKRTIVYPENQRIYYENISADVTKVLIKMIPSIADLKDEDSVPVPAMREQQYLETIIQFFQEPQSVVPDKLNDENNQQIST